MKLIINGDEYWIKDNVKLPSNFDSMNSIEKWRYILENKITHREDGPAFIGNNGIQEWHFNGLRHRLDGPAEIFNNGNQFWLLNNTYVNEKIYKKIQSSSKGELLVYMIDSKYKDYLPLIEYRMNQ